MYRASLQIAVFRSPLSILLCCGSSVASLGAQVFFSDSESSGDYESGLAFKTDPSRLAQVGPSGDKLPTSDTALVGRDAVRLDWESREGGDWSALLIAPGFVGQDLSELDTLGLRAHGLDGRGGARLARPGNRGQSAQWNPGVFRARGPLSASATTAATSSKPLS